MVTDEIRCREVAGSADAILPAVAALYEQTQHPDERVPWAWIGGSLKSGSKPNAPARHLVVAEAGGLAGFALGSYLPGYGGYVSYLGVDPAARGRGIGAALFDALFARFAADAEARGEALPFAVWESKRPADGAPDADRATWAARLRLFAKVGARRVEGVELHTPNYTRPDRPGPVLRLFVKPMSWAAESLTPTRLKVIAEGLMSRVYKLDPADELWQATFGCEPELELADEAAPPPG